MAVNEENHEPEVPEVESVAGPTPGKLFRKSALYGLAGVLLACDKVAGAARKLVQGIHKGAVAAIHTAAEESSPEAGQTPKPKN